jgi:predicted AAA+ superfamily ATPase
MAFPQYTYISVEDPVVRREYTRMTAAQWKELYPSAILDEVQKEPGLIESIKAVYDQWSEPRYILSGSSQLLLLEKVKESLAGRCVILELYPLTVPELGTDAWEDEIHASLFIQSLERLNTIHEILPSFLLDSRHVRKKRAWDHYIRFGGYPALTSSDLSDEERYEWLSNYVRTYLERDIRDLAAFRDLDAFMRLQHYLALQTGTIVNASSIAAQVGLSIKTVQRYIRYFELSYQALVLPAWSRNETRRLVKAPKIHYLDNGVLQAVIQKRGFPSGPEFESLVAAEMYKQARTMRLDARFYHLRTADGREVDLLIETPSGYYAFEIKMADRIVPSDARHLRGICDILDKPLLHSFIMSNDPQTQRIADDITAVNAAYFLA